MYYIIQQNNIQISNEDIFVLIGLMFITGIVYVLLNKN